MSTATRALLAAAGLAVLAGCTTPTVAPEPSQSSTATPTLTATDTATAAPVTIVRVVDGDTLITTQTGTETTIRVLAIDTPEVFGGVQCGGKEASDHAKTLLPAGTAVTLTPDPTQDDKDRYGRSLRYVTVAGQDFGRVMIDAGLAHAYRLKSGKPPQRYAEYAAAEAAAKTAHTGPLATCTP